MVHSAEVASTNPLTSGIITISQFYIRDHILNSINCTLELKSIVIIKKEMYAMRDAMVLEISAHKAHIIVQAIKGHFNQVSEKEAASVNCCLLSKITLSPFIKECEFSCTMISKVCFVPLLPGMILYTFIQFQSTPAIVTSVFIGLGIVFCGCALVHTVFVWQKVSIRRRDGLVGTSRASSSCSLESIDRSSKERGQPGSGLSRATI